MAISAATSIVDFIRTDPDVAAGIVGMPSYLHSMTAFACMFLIKVAVKYGGHLIERERVYDMITSLVQQFRSTSTGKWHLVNLMAGGLEKMAATLNPSMETHFGQLQDVTDTRNGTNGVVDALGQGAGIEGQFPGMEGDLFFDYGMSFGLSPVFRFDPSALNLDGSTPQIQDFADVDYRMRP